MGLKAFIADDDAGMRLVLRKIIEEMDGYEYAGEAADGEETVRSCVELKPDIVFMDVEMPVMNGVEAARKLLEKLPELHVIFVTAHGEYMIDAFEVYASDYLMKPFRTDRVRQTLRRIQKNQVRSYTKPALSLMLKNKNGLIFVPVKDIILIHRENRVTNIETTEGSYTAAESLSELLNKLGDMKFFRCHRAYIINTTAVSKIYPYGRWTYLVKLRGCEKDALITHEKLEELQAILGA